ncbi:MAG: hypothetical protein KF782_10480 [Labilithrix sp.]|nr:hypothetical protein [Labilithrix sp.]
MTATTSLDSDAGVERDANGDVIAFRLFRAGLSRTDHGSTLFDGEAARLVMAEREQRGNRYALDFDHKSIDPSATPEQRRAAGSFDIALRDGELWAVDVRWTDEARRYVRGGQYLSVSPAWDQSTKNGRVVSLMNCALTSNPATHGAVRLAASRTAITKLSRILAARKRSSEGMDEEPESERGSEDGEQMTIDQVIEALRVIASDRDAPAEDSERASKMLKAIERDPNEDPDVRNEAYRASKRVEAKRALDEQMGLRWARRPYLEGTRMVHPVMTADEARSYLAQKGAR